MFSQLSTMALVRFILFYLILLIFIISEHCVFINAIISNEKNESFTPLRPNLSDTLQNVEFAETLQTNDKGTGEIDSVLTIGVNKLSEIYQDCTNKIDRRVESILNWRFANTKNLNDLLELKEYVTLLYRCLKVQSFRYFDSVLAQDVIPITNHVELMRSGGSYLPLHSDFVDGRVSSNYVSEIVTSDWNSLLLDRFSKLLESHMMKFRLDSSSIQARGRRREYKMFAMMVMGFMIMATILIPMGFQFLTVLGGKSLLMAKMALIMSAINGLKKIATTPVGYGFYHSGPEAHHDHHGHHGFHDKLIKVGLKHDNDNFI